MKIEGADAPCIHRRLADPTTPGYAILAQAREEAGTINSVQGGENGSASRLLVRAFWLLPSAELGAAPDSLRSEAISW